MGWMPRWCVLNRYIKNSDPQTRLPLRGTSGQVTQITRIKIGGSVDLEKCPRVECHNGVCIKRVWSFLFDKNKILGRILNSASCFLSMLPAVFSTGKNNLLIFNTNPALLPFLGFIAAKLRGQRYVVLWFTISGRNFLLVWSLSTVAVNIRRTCQTVHI